LTLFIYLQLANSIRLHIHGNRVLIKTMQLLGSTNGFIQKPYLINAILVGFLGGFIGFVLADGAFTIFLLPSLKLNRCFLIKQIKSN
jgi:cell division transport system permease protein